MSPILRAANVPFNLLLLHESMQWTGKLKLYHLASSLYLPVIMLRKCHMQRPSAQRRSRLQAGWFLTDQVQLHRYQTAGKCLYGNSRQPWRLEANKMEWDKISRIADKVAVGVATLWSRHLKTQRPTAKKRSASQ